MKIHKFRIWNYKSIIDSRDCYPLETITIFAGKNEAGKTSILEALEDFNSDTEIRDDAVPILGEENSQPRIAVTFEVSKGDILEIFEHISVSTEQKFQDFTEITLEKTFPNEYSLTKQSVARLKLSAEKPAEDFSGNIQAEIEVIKPIHSSHISQIGSIPLPSVDQDDYAVIKEKWKEYKSQIQPHLPDIPEEPREQIDKALKKIDEICRRAIEVRSPLSEFVDDFVEYIPNFILFSSFDDIFPNIIPLNELKENVWIKDLILISDINVDTIISGAERKKKGHKKKLNIQINEDFKKFWAQDLSSLEIDWDNEKLLFWIEEDGQYFEPARRSHGRRWHLAFYVKVTARAREDLRNVILIDEPGLYLHAKAQRDILKSLDEAAKEVQVFFSTHSPYLLEADKLERIRLVEKTGKYGTTILSKLHKVADKETLTPILTAIGLEINTGIANLDKVNNVIVEGASDYYYLNAFKRFLKKEHINFVHGGGAGNMPVVGTILQGWGCEVIYLFDDDQGAKDAVKHIKSDWVTTAEEMLRKIPIAGASIEDVFSKTDYAKYVLCDPQANVKGKNSAHAKSKRDKVLDAKLFLETIKRKEFGPDAETKKNMMDLFKIVDSKLSNGD